MPWFVTVTNKNCRPFCNESGVYVREVPPWDLPGKFDHKSLLSLVIVGEILLTFTQRKRRTLIFIL
jgi:hypothetical protein